MLSDKSVQEITAQVPGSTDANRAAPAHIDTRSSVTMDAIKSYILRHGLRPGDHLPTESALCADLGVSRSSVREALRKLQALDIVTVRQGSGSYVGDMSLQPMVETLVLRAALDDINGVQSLHSIVETRHALDLGIALPLTRAMKGTSNPELWELVNTMTDHAHAGERTPPRRTPRSCARARPGTRRRTPQQSTPTTNPSWPSSKAADQEPRRVRDELRAGAHAEHRSGKHDTSHRPRSRSKTTTASAPNS